MEDILVPVSLFAMIFGIVLVSNYFSGRNRIARYRVLEKLLDKSGDISPEMYEDLKVQLGDGHFKSDLRRGLGLVFTGIALCVFFALISYDHGGHYFLVCIGLFPLGAGLARLINYYAEHRHQALPKN